MTTAKTKRAIPVVVRSAAEEAERSRSQFAALKSGRGHRVLLDPMTHDEKLFFKQLGVRIAALRKDQAMTQVRLAKAMDVSQQTVASWKVGRRAPAG